MTVLKVPPSDPMSEKLAIDILINPGLEYACHKDLGIQPISTKRAHEIAALIQQQQQLAASQEREQQANKMLEMKQSDWLEVCKENDLALADNASKDEALKYAKRMLRNDSMVDIEYIDKALQPHPGQALLDKLARYEAVAQEINTILNDPEMCNPSEHSRLGKALLKLQQLTEWEAR